jgi:drug/metabolite transporter (DMT)-like permease
MLAVLPLLGGLLLGRFVANRRVAAAGQAAFYVLAAVVLIATAPSHGSSHSEGALLALVLAPAAAATFALGIFWKTRSVSAHA